MSILPMISYLATEHEGGFGLNLNLFETNLINLGIILAALFSFGRKFLANLLNERRDRIQQEISEAEERAQNGAAALADAQQKLAQAQSEAQRIRAQAEETAKRAKEEILAKGEQDLLRLRATAAADLTSEEDKAIAELRQRVAALAMARVENRLQEVLNDDKQGRLIDRCLSQIGG